MPRPSWFSSTFLLSILVCLVEAQNGQVSQIHIAQGQDPSVMTIMWVTPNAAASLCWFGTEPTDLDQTATGSSESYAFTYSKYPTYQSGALHAVELIDLKADTTYFYQCGDEAQDVSGILSFTTMFAPGDPRPFWFGVLGDLGQTDDSRSTMNHIAMNPELGLILHAGDLSYANCDQTKWDTYGLMVQDLASARPWHVNPGNHEIEIPNSDSTGGDLFTAYEARYKMPGSLQKPAQYGSITYEPYYSCTPSAFQTEYDYGSAYYSFDAGSAHVVSLSCYSTTDSESLQYKWLESDLASVDRDVTPWIIMMSHCPWYNSNTAHQDEYQTVVMKQDMEALINKYKVNVMMAGHVHAYERTYGVYNNKTSEDGVVYINIGDGGNAEGHAEDYIEPTPEWSAFRNGTQYGHGALYLANATHMQWNWYRNADGVKVWSDGVWICNTATTGSNLCAASSMQRRIEKF